LSALFITPILHVFDKRIKNLKIPVSFLYFVNDGFFISQEKSFDILNTNLFYGYNIMLSLLKQFGLVIKHEKTKVFHFSRLHSIFSPLPLNLSQIGGPILHPKDTWQYLRFIFNRKFTFCQHIKFYTNKALFTIKCMKMLSNSMWGLLPYQKHLLYRIYILSIILYSFFF